MRRFYEVFSVALLLFTLFSVNISRANMAVLTCEAKDGKNATDTHFSATGGDTLFNPGERLLIAFSGSGAFPATRIRITGAGAPGLVDLPYTLNFASIPNGVTWFIRSAAPTGASPFTATEHCVGSSSSSSAGAGCPVFDDGRLNDCDTAQSFAVYCQKDGSVMVLAIDDSKGSAAFVASPQDIKQVPTKPAVNTLIKSGNGASLYRLTTGELQVNRPEDGTGKIYKFIFKECPKP